MNRLIDGGTFTVCVSPALLQQEERMGREVGWGRVPEDAGGKVSELTAESG